MLITGKSRIMKKELHELSVICDEERLYVGRQDASNPYVSEAEKDSYLGHRSAT